MSVTTTADQKISSAKESIKDAVVNLATAISYLQEATDSDTWGSKEFKESYFDLLLDSQMNILEFSNSLKKIIQKI